MPTAKEYRAKDGSRSWRVRIRAGGKETSQTFRTEAAAAVFCRQVEAFGAARALAELKRRNPDEDEYVPTLREWYATVMKHKTGITGGTRDDYDRLANRVLLPMLGSMPLDLIDRKADSAFIQKLEKTPRLNNKGKPTTGYLSPKTIAGHHGLLSDLMNLAVIEGHITVNPCRGARLPKLGDHERRDERFLTHSEWRALYEQLPEAHRPLAHFLVGTGLRWSEATALQVRHIDLTHGTVRVVQAWKKRKKGEPRRLGPPKSPKSRRTVVMPAQVVDTLRPLIAGRKADGWVFRAARGGIIHGSSWHSRVWAPAVAAAEISPPPRIHDLRHTHASWLIEQGATLEQVQDQLGHESILTTRKIYGSLQPSMRAKLQAAATAALAQEDPAQIEG